MNDFITIDGVTKLFGRRAALQDVSFSVRPGEVLGLIGPNGAGKTTLFECLAGLMPADSGSIKAGENPLAAAHRKRTLFYLPDGGKVGVWSKTDSVSYFDDFTVNR